MQLQEDPVSLETPVGEGDSQFCDLIEDVNAQQPDEAVAYEHEPGELEVALDRSERAHAQVVELRYGLDG